MYIKTIKRQRKDGSVKINFYWAENYREGRKVKVRILRPASEQEALIYFKKRESQKTIKDKETILCLSCNKANLMLTWTADEEIYVKCPKCGIERKYV